MKIADISDILLELGLSAAVTDEERALAQASLVKSEGSVLRYLHYNPAQNTHTEFYPQMDFALRGRDFVWETDNQNAFIRDLASAATNELQIKNLPIRSIISLHIDFDARSGSRAGSFPDPAKIEGDDFWPNWDSLDSLGEKICRDGIIRSIGRWPSISGSVKLIYVAGYTKTELRGQDTVIDASPIFDVTVDEASRFFLKTYSRRKRGAAGFTGPFSSEKLGDYAYTTDTTILNTLVGGSIALLPENREKLNEFCVYNMGVM